MITGMRRAFVDCLRSAAEGPLSLRVFGCLPVTGRRGCTADLRKASREETAEEFAPTLVSVYGEFAGAA